MADQLSPPEIVFPLLLSRNNGIFHYLATVSKSLSPVGLVLHHFLKLMKTAKKDGNLCLFLYPALYSIW